MGSGSSATDQPVGGGGSGLQRNRLKALVVVRAFVFAQTPLQVNLQTPSSQRFSQRTSTEVAGWELTGLKWQTF